MSSTSTALTVAGFDVAQCPSLIDHGSHDHGLNTEVGYVLRQTKRDGVFLWHHPADADGINRGPIGQDVAGFDGLFAAERAFRTANTMRLSGNYAVVDRVYACGCRS